MRNQSQEDYLKAIFLLIEKNGQNDIRSVEIAASLDVSKPAVSKMLRRLHQKKLILTKRYSDISLTKNGLKKAKMLIYKHRIIEVFLAKILKINKKSVHQEAHRLEHAFSDEVIAKLADYLGNPKLCPGGSTIPIINK